MHAELLLQVYFVELVEGLRLCSSRHSSPAPWCAPCRRLLRDLPQKRLEEKSILYSLVLKQSFLTLCWVRGIVLGVRECEWAVIFRELYNTKPSFEKRLHLFNLRK